MSRQKPAEGTESSWKTSTRVVQRENVRSHPPHRVLIGKLPGRAVEEGHHPPDRVDPLAVGIFTVEKLQAHNNL